jgi:hypothetical protein
MDEYLEFKIKTHKGLNKKILFLRYKKEDFDPDEDTMYKLIDTYFKEIKGHGRLIIIVDLRELETWNKKTAWEGAAEVKKEEKLVIETVSQFIIITENKIMNGFLNIILQVMGNKIKTNFVNDINSALEILN